MIDGLKRTLKWGGLGVLVLIGLMMLDLYTVQWVLEDPGYYVVARRSDTPDQVLDALERLRDDPDVTERQLRVLVDRYRGKARTESLPSAEREKWRRAHARARALLRARRKTSPPP